MSSNAYSNGLEFIMPRKCRKNSFTRVVFGENLPFSPSVTYVNDYTLTIFRQCCDLEELADVDGFEVLQDFIDDGNAHLERWFADCCRTHPLWVHVYNNNDCNSHALWRKHSASWSRNVLCAVWFKFWQPDPASSDRQIARFFLPKKCTLLLPEFLVSFLELFLSRKSLGKNWIRNWDLKMPALNLD